MARVLLVGVWLLAASVVATLGVLGYQLTKDGPVVPNAMTIERLPPRQRHNPMARWSVTEHLNAHNVIIAHVETDYLDEATAIARELTEPVKDRYSEVLIYFHRPGRPDALSPRRVQWSASAGYIETVYDPDPGATPR